MVGQQVHNNLTKNINIKTTKRYERFNAKGYSKRVENIIVPKKTFQLNMI